MQAPISVEGRPPLTMAIVPLSWYLSHARCHTSVYLITLIIVLSILYRERGLRTLTNSLRLSILLFARK